MNNQERVTEDANFYEFLSISDLSNSLNKFVNYRKHHKSTWMMLDGTIVKIKGMSTEHILNAMVMLERTEQIRYKAYIGLSEELDRRAYALPKM